MPIVAWYILSKESYMKRVIKDVLPTTERNVQSATELLRFRTRLTALFAQENEPTILSYIAQNTGRQQSGTHLNFFKGFEYEPTAVCDAIVAHAGKKRFRKGNRKER